MVGIELLLLTIGGWLASPVIKSVFDKAEKHLNDNYELQKNTREMVLTLIQNLELCHATLVKATERKVNHSESELATTLKRLKEAVYDAEDVLDNIEAKSIEQKLNRKNKVCGVASSSHTIVLKVDDDLKKLKEVLDKLTTIKDEIPMLVQLLGMKENDGKASNSKQTISKQTEDVAKYRPEEFKNILQMILPPDDQSRSRSNENKGQTSHHLIVLPIVGIGGVGKTELAKAVYNDSDVEQAFVMKAWIYVSSNLEIESLMMDILDQFFDESLSSNKSLEYVSKYLSRKIKEVKILVVLDDINEKIQEQWHNLKAILSCGASGSVVLITTHIHNQAFANEVATKGPIQLNPLEKTIFWELFKHIVFVNDEEKENTLDARNMEVIGRRIAGKLHGLPLAAKIIGGILRRNILKLDVWRKIDQSKWWKIPEVESKILPSVAIGYQHLDPCLRQCFAFCSVIPKNLLINKDKLVQMWIAQNFIPHDKNGVKMEVTGREWFDKLVEMFFFQPVGDYKNYVMPSLMHDLAEIVSSEECFYFTPQSTVFPQNVRHLAVEAKNLDLLKEFTKQIREGNHIRSFLYFGSSDVDGLYTTINETLSNLNKIRVLDLSYLHMETKEPPSAIQNMPHLRFLDLSSTGIEVLTHSRFDHYHLQALYIQGCPLSKLDCGMNRLINLRHLNADFKTIVLISGIGQLVNLQELDEYIVGKEEGHKITELKNLKELTGHLRISNCENIESKDEAEQARLADKKELESIELCWSSVERKSKIIDMEILEGLKPNAEYVYELTINSYMGSSFPNWMREMNDFFYLQTLRLISCINIQLLPPLELLPSLSAVQIVGCYNLKSLEKSLQHLTSLSLLHIANYKMRISLIPNDLRFLEDLMLRDCPELSIQGHLKSLTNLKRLEITSCPKLLSSYIPNDNHTEETLRSLSYLEMDQNLLCNDIHLILGRLPSLRFLVCKNLLSTWVLERWFEHLTALLELTFSDSEFDRLPKHLNKLFSLKKLKLVSCSKLERLEEDDMPPSLREFVLEASTPQLATGCEPDGEYWELISHIPIIRIDGRTIDRPQTGVELLSEVWFASAIIARVLNKAEHHGVERQMDWLHEIKAMIEKAEKRMINSSNLAVQLRMLKRALYDAEDVLDNIEAKSVKQKFQGKNMVREFVSSSHSSFMNTFVPNDTKRLQEVLHELRRISLDIRDTNILNMHGDRFDDNLNRFERNTISRPAKVDFYVRQKEKNLILGMILDPVSGFTLNPEPASSWVWQGRLSKNYDGLLVLPIVGMDGVGKTTLAQAVYNDPEVQQTFVYKAWNSIASNFNVVRLMHNIFESLAHPILDVKELDAISKNLSEKVRGERFLAVLDDMNEKIEEQWDDLHTVLSCSAHGSVVLITTHNHAFADRIGTLGYIALNPLDWEDFWELFKKLAFGDKYNNSLEVIGERIARKLCGLPLEAKIMGEILRYASSSYRLTDIHEWKRISRSKWWDIPEGTGRSKILPSIAIGYQHLDPYLRQCFAFCSVFPRNSLLDKDRLVQMWIAHDFIPSRDINGAIINMEDTGREWFDKLVEMSFFEPAGDYKCYVMSNLVHNLADMVSSDECFYLTDQSHEIPPSVRHLAVDTNNLDLLKQIPKQSHIGSFLYFGLSDVDGLYATIDETLSNLNSIRILDLSYLRMETKEPPPAIQNMPHLRFLDLSSTGIEVLTHSRFDHYHLQALHIQRCPLIEQLPTGINSMINLRHLNADSKTIALISGIGQLVDLQELDEYIVGKEEGHKITELKQLRLTGHLRIRNCENIRSKHEAEEARLVYKWDLNSVELFWSSTPRESNIDKEILEGLEPYHGINDLKVYNYMGSSFPDWMGGAMSLRKICLVKCHNIEVLPPLGELNFLQHLELEELSSVKIINHYFCGDNDMVFRALTYFRFSELSSCENWTKPPVAEFFPHLSTLEIMNNNALRETPLHFFSISLKALKITSCHNLNSLGESLRHLRSLSLLHVIYNEMITSFNINDLRLLMDLILRGCPELSIEGDLQSLTNLKRLEITGCPKLLSKGMPEIKSKIKGKGLQVHQEEGLRSLSYLKMDESILQTKYHLILGMLPSLRFLHFQGSEPKEFTKDQTHWFQKLTTLKELTFSNSEFRHLPSSLAQMSSLRKLMLNSCDNLESLPVNGMPPFLWELTFDSCSENLVQRCHPDKGEDWKLISHVLLVRINGEISRPRCLAGTSGVVPNRVLPVNGRLPQTFIDQLVRGAEIIKRADIFEPSVMWNILRNRTRHA
ncbi:Disease resistance protein [Rhynchospora pubera]|uniref:Disease resistance protein n=1 Tax=Rhynchospora pubera TaxID=906938 RepID=A0AAV8EI34_9POAL|nr:Disease resistance protein [Rhynchospora pubera]